MTALKLAILCELFDNVFMTTRQIQSLHGERAFRHLRELRLAGLIIWPEEQWVIRHRTGGGSNPRIHTLSNEGAAIVCQAGLRTPVARDWTGQGDPSVIGLLQIIRHRLAITEVRIAFRQACKLRGLRLRDAHELAYGQNARRLIVPGREKSLRPDWIFAIERGDGAGEPALFFLELDRDTEPNVRNRGPEDLESLERKFGAYLAYARAKCEREQFRMSGFRVLTVTTNNDRKVANVVETARSIGNGLTRFLVTRFDRIAGQDPLAALWIDTTGSSSPIRL